MKKIGTLYQYRQFSNIVRRSIMFPIMIGTVALTTLIVLVGGSMMQSSLYNNLWLASGNDPPECLSLASNDMNCSVTDGEYYHGFYWSSHITQSSILIAGILLGVKLRGRKTEKIPVRLLVIIACIIVLVVVSVFVISYVKTQGYFEWAYDVVMFTCFDERGRPDLRYKIIHQNDTHFIDSKTCEWKERP